MARISYRQLEETDTLGGHVRRSPASGQSGPGTLNWIVQSSMDPTRLHDHRSMLRYFALEGGNCDSDHSDHDRLETRCKVHLCLFILRLMVMRGSSAELFKYLKKFR